MKCRFSLLLMLALFASCEKEYLSNSTASVLKVTPKQALLSVDLDMADLPSKDCEAGIAYARTDAFDGGNLTYVPFQQIESSAMPIKMKLVNLECGVAYDYCVYYKSGNDVVKGQRFHFNTDPLPKYAVDLGLPNDLLWADRNLNSDDPYTAGGNYAWAETAPKDLFSINNCKYLIQMSFVAPYDVSKYTIEDKRYNSTWYNDKKEFIGDGKVRLDPEDDAAHVQWGEGWRMPTPEDFLQLTEQCTVTASTILGREGVYVRSTNEASVFFPFAVFPKHELVTDYQDDECDYWTNTVSDKEHAIYPVLVSSMRAVLYQFRYKNSHDHGITVKARWTSCQIRAVYDCNISL